MKQETGSRKKRTHIPQQRKLIAELQQEINSACPLCYSTDVGVFELHHIDENPNCHDKVNLLLVCPTCHAKIDKKIITMEIVRMAKTHALNRNSKIEFVSALVDKEQCGWYIEKENCFYDGRTRLPGTLIISFTLLNHFPQTVVLKSIRIFVKRLPSGLSGVPTASTLKSIIQYRCCINLAGENIYPLEQPLQIPANVGAKFDAAVYYEASGGNCYAPVGRSILYFSFDFSGNNSVTIPPIFLNCCSENEPLKIGYMG